MDQGIRCFFGIHVRTWLVLSLLGSTLGISWAMGPQEQASSAEDVRRLCGYTGYPSMCLDTLLARQEFGQGLAGLVSLLVERTWDETLLATSKYQLEGGQSTRAQEATGYCDELMEMSRRRLNQSLTALHDSPWQSKEDIQTWLSAVLTFSDSCKDTVSEFPSVLSSHISSRLDNLSMVASNALALANRIADGGAAQPQSRRLQGSQDAFPTWVSEKGRDLLGSTELIKPDAVVALDGSGDYTSIAAALKGTSSNTGDQTLILMKAGVYKERLNINRDGVTLLGEGKGSTIITDDSSVGGGSSMPGTATVVVTGDRFIAKDIAFENSAGPHGHQALALRIASDHAVLYRCSLRGYQDTLYALALRQFYRDCDIRGSIDFIFGNAAAVFQNCDLLLRRPRSGGFNAVMANGRSDPGQNTGFVAHKCNIGADSDLFPVRHSVKSYLGRPWKKCSRAVIMQSSIDDSIQPKGWAAWSGGFALSSLYFAEYLNSGPGAQTASRVNWPGYHVLGDSEATKFTVSNFIQGGSWLPATGVTFDPQLG